MLDTTNIIVQALVWTTIAGMLYAVWLKTETTARYKIDLSFYWQQVIEILSWMWVLLAIALVISMLIFAWPRPTAASMRSATECVAATQAGSLNASGASVTNVCPDSGPQPPSP